MEKKRHYDTWITITSRNGAELNRLYHHIANTRERYIPEGMLKDISYNVGRGIFIHELTDEIPVLHKWDKLASEWLDEYQLSYKSHETTRDKYYSNDMPNGQIYILDWSPWSCGNFPYTEEYVLIQLNRYYEKDGKRFGTLDDFSWWLQDSGESSPFGIHKVEYMDICEW